MTGERALLVTGAGGFVGTRLLRCLEPALFRRIVCLARQTAATSANARAGVETAIGDLLHPDTYAAALTSCDTVVHLAGLTGKARAHELFEVNREGTRRLLDACRKHGVRDFLFVSSIAARWKARHYPYADAKREAEAAVAESGLRHVIVRPTPVFGPGSAIWKSLARLARMPISPIFGDGRTVIQPIDVEDLARCLRDLILEDRFEGETLELGGPEAIAIEELIRRMREAFGRKPGRVVHLPLRTIQSALAGMERWFLPVLPFTAGQLSTFGHDGAVTPGPFLRARWPAMKNVAAMIAEATAADKGP